MVSGFRPRRRFTEAVDPEPSTQHVRATGGSTGDAVDFWVQLRGERLKRIVKAIGVAGVLSALAGCATNTDQGDPLERLAAAKELTQHSERAAVALLRKEDVIDIDQLSEGTFLPCSDGYVWSGNIRASLREGMDGGTAQETLAMAAKERGDDVREDKLLSGRRRYTITTADGVEMLLTVWEHGTVLDIDSASPCIRLPADFKRPRIY